MDADITRCTHTACAVRHDCVRFSAPVLHPTRQRYANFFPDPTTGRCVDFIDRDTLQRFPVEGVEVAEEEAQRDSP